MTGQKERDTTIETLQIRIIADKLQKNGFVSNDPMCEN